MLYYLFHCRSGHRFRQHLDCLAYRYRSTIAKVMKVTKDSRNAIGEDSAGFTSINSDDGIPSTGSQYGSIEPHIFTEPSRAEHWRSVYGASKYECRHRFDPAFQWSATEEKKALRKVSKESSIDNVSPIDQNWCVGGLAHHALGVGHVLFSRPGSPEH